MRRIVWFLAAALALFCAWPTLADTAETLPGDNSVEITGNVRTELDDESRPARSVATGPVTLRHRSITVTSDEGAEIDYKTNLAVFRGNIVFRVNEQEAKMTSLTLNLKTREWSGDGATTTISPQFAKGSLRAPVFVQGQRISGIGRQQIGLLEGDSTTCDLPHAHYHFSAGSVVVYPDDKIVLQDASMYALGKRIFKVSRFVISLKQLQRNPDLIPRVGQSVEEGFFLKTSYSFLGSRTTTGLLDLDVMTRKGIGTGIRNYWKSSASTGEAQVYHLYDNNTNQNTLTGRFSHSQDIGTLKATVSTDFRSNSYLYASDSKSMLNRFTLNRDRPGANTSLSYNQSISNYINRTSNVGATLRHSQRFGDAARLRANFDYIGFSSDQPTRARLTSDVILERNEKSFDWHISARQFTDLSDEAFVGQTGFGGLESLPEIGIATDTQRLRRTLFGLPANLHFTYGQYTELPTNTELGRTYLALDTPVRKHQLSKTWSLGAGAGFKQYVYSDNTAQYSFDTSARLTKQLGPTSALNFTYRLQKPEGFAPLRFDYVGKYNVVNASLDMRDNQKFRMSLLTGYNFVQKDFPWQDVVLRMTVEPSKNLLFYTATSYDFNNSRWRTLINQIRIRSGKDFKLDIGTRYDTTRKKLATARVLLNTPLDKKTRLEALAGYNGFTSSFDYKAIAITRDLHCWEASLAYIDQGGFYRNKGLTLNFSIKAFPMARAFGLGPFAQADDTSVGQVY